MKRSPYFFSVVTCMLLLTSIQNKSDSSSESITLDTAINKGLIYCEFNGAGGFSGKTVVIKMNNKKNGALTISIPAGTLFYPKDPGQQTLITVEEQFVSLAPGEKKSETVFAYCSEHNDRSPNSSSTFTLGKNSKPKFDSLFMFIKPFKVPQKDHQAMVWAISDNSPVSAVSGNTPSMKRLRKFLFALTGQEEEDFTSDFILSVDENGYIVKTLYQIKGELELSSDKNRFLYQEVYLPDGKMKYRSNMAFEIPEGKSSYSFNICVKDWQKGRYTMKLKDGKNVLGTYSFNV